MMGFPFIDSHCHRFIASPQGTIRIVNLPADWSLDGMPEGNPFSAGVHPWDLKDGLGEDRIEALRETLSIKGAAAVGECGLDRAIEAPFGVQMESFAAQARLAEEMELPVIIHCVRAYPEIISVRKSLKSARPWLAHGFKGGDSTARELLRHGIRLSFGGRLPPFDVGGLPEGSFLLETDDSGEMIETVYEKAAVAAGCDIEGLKESLFNTFLSVFGERAIPDDRR